MVMSPQADADRTPPTVVGAARPTGARRPVPARSEVTRLMCVAGYLDRPFRDRVIARLVEDQGRVAAPSVGFDAVPVIAHCLRARALERAAARRYLLSWLLVVLAVAVLVWRVAAVVVTRGAGVEPYVLAFAAVLAAGVLLAPGLAPRTGRHARLVGPVVGIGSWFLPRRAAHRHRRELLGILVDELGEERFTGRAPRVDFEHRQVVDAVAREQHSAVVVYNPADPFLGYGVALRRWTVALELRPVDDGAKGDGAKDGAAKGAEDGGASGARTARRPAAGSGAPPHTLTARRVIDLIRPQLAALTESAAATGRDRLGELEISEQVFLPGPLPYGPSRADLPVGPPQAGGVAGHLADAVGEGGEPRRHFLVIRIPAWGEQVVTTVFVRVHTQGRMLLLEVAPHVLTPLSARFQGLGAVVEALEVGVDPARLHLGALAPVPTRTLVERARNRTVPSADPRTWRNWVRPPETSLRERGQSGVLSVFQEMDVTRYVKTVEVRIAEGVRQALKEAGFKTDEFQQQIVTIGEGGVFIGGSMSGGAVASGKGARARHDEAPAGGPAPEQKGK